RVGPIDVVQYRGEIMPLINVSQVLRPREKRQGRGTRGEGRGTGSRPSPLAARPSASDSLQVVVYAGRGQQVGLVVDRILDIAEETLVSRAPAHSPGVLFTAVIQGRVTEFLDVEHVLNSADPVFLEPPRAVAAER